MSDLIKLLRSTAPVDMPLCLLMEAADEIERLTADNEMLRDELEQQYARVEELEGDKKWIASAAEFGAMRARVDELEAVIADMPCTCEGIWHMCDSCKVLEGRHE